MSEYAQWKILAWRFLRGAIAGGLSSVFILYDFTNPAIVKSLVEDPIKALPIIKVAFITGVIVTLGKWLRDEFGNGGTAKIDKLPF